MAERRFGQLGVGRQQVVLALMGRLQHGCRAGLGRQPRGKRLRRLVLVANQAIGNRGCHKTVKQPTHRGDASGE